MRAGALNMGTFFEAQPDTPTKLAGFAYAFEALETGAYELLTRVARRAGDDETAAVAERIAGEERAAGERVAATWDEAAELALRETVAGG
jgi:ferritin-like metal-binding protein YciE